MTAATAVVLPHTATHRSPLGQLGRRRLLMAGGTAMAATTIVANIGWSAAAVAATFLTIVVAARAVWRRSHAAAVAALSTLLGIGAVLGIGFAADPIDMWTGGFAYYGTYLLALPALSLLVISSNRQSFGLGSTTVMAHLTLVATLPIRMITAEAVLAPIAGIALATGVIWWRTRLAPQADIPARPWPRIAVQARRLGAKATSMVLIAGALMIGGAGTAHAIWPFSQISGSVSDSVHEMLCGVTTPDLTQKPVGAGPEAWFSNRNLAQATDSSGQVPEHAKDVVLRADDDMSRYTLYEISGLRGLDWVNWQYNPGSTASKPENCSISAWMWTMSGNAVFTVNNYLLQATIAMKELAQSSNPVAWLYDRTDSSVANLFIRVVVPLMSIALLFSAVAIAVRSLRGGNNREMWGKLGASVGVMVLAGFIFGGLSATDSGPSLENPNGSGFYTAASILDETLGGVNSAISTAVLSQIDADTDASQAFCRIPSGNSEELGQRVSSCVLAETLAYRPWAIGQFGPAASKPVTAADAAATGQPSSDGETSLPCYVQFGECKDLRAYLIAQQGGPAISNEINDCLGGGDDYSRDKADECIPYFAVAKQLSERITTARAEQSRTTEASGDAVTMFNAYTGGNGLQRLTQASSSLIGTILVTVMLLTLAVITVVWHVILFCLFLIGPISFAIGSYMGKTHLVRSWVFDAITTFTARAAYSFALTMIIFIICLVFRSESIYPGMKILILAMVLFGFWKLVHKIDEHIRPDGGSLNMNVADATQRRMSQATNAYRNNRFDRQVRQMSGRRSAIGAAGAGAAGAAKMAGRTVSGGGRAIRGAGVGAANALGGTHKANNEAARELGYGKARMAARRVVTGIGAGTAGAVQGGYRGARGQTPKYRKGSVRPVDQVLAAGREVRFRAQYQALRLKPQSPVEKQAAKRYAEKQAAKKPTTKG